MTATTTVTTHKNTASIPSREVGKQVGVASQTRFPTFSEWVWGNRHALETAQLRDGYDWLCSSMQDAPDQGLFEAKIGERGWFDRHGKRGNKAAFTAAWGETKSGAPLLRIAVNDFRRDPQSWNGKGTITRLWDDAKGVPKGPRTARQQRDARLEQKTHDYNALVDAERRSRDEATESAKRAESLRNAVGRWHTLPTTGSSPYITRKGLAERDWWEVRHDGHYVEIALQNPEGDNQTGIQRIEADGSKKLVWEPCHINFALTLASC